MSIRLEGAADAGMEGILVWGTGDEVVSLAQMVTASMNREAEVMLRVGGEVAVRVSANGDVERARLNLGGEYRMVKIGGHRE